MNYTQSVLRGAVLDFVSTPSSYTIYVEPALRLDVARCQSLEAGPLPDGPYWSYLWVQAVQGFFVLRQPIIEGRPGPWEMLYQVEPDEFSSLFFPWVEENFQQLIRDWNERSGEVALPSLGNDPGEVDASEGE